MYKKSVLIIATVTILAGSAFAQTIKIGVSGPFTGLSASTGVSMRDGARLAAAEINRAGGIMGNQIALVERDDESRADTGTRIAQDLIGKEGVVATVGYVDTDVALASQRIYQDSEIPVLTNIATGTIITRQFQPPAYKANYIFRTAANDAVQSGLIVQEAIVRQKFKSPAILADSTDYGSLGRAGLESALKEAGVTPVGVETFNIGDTDMTVQLSRAKQAGADAILVYGAGTELARVANSMARLGWKLPIIGGWTLSTTNFMDIAGATGDGAMMPQTFIQGGNTEKRARFIAAYQIAYKVVRLPSPVAAAQGYDSVLLLKAAIEQAKSTEGSKIRVALEDLRTRVEGVVTIYDRPFSPADHEAITANIPVMGAVRGRHVVAAHEEDIAGAKAIRVKQK